jgi:hypothetical protein
VTYPKGIEEGDLDSFAIWHHIKVLDHPGGVVMQHPRAHKGKE